MIRHPYDPIASAFFNYSGHIYVFDDISSGPALLKTEDYPLPVELASFMAEQIENFVHLQWETASELNNHGFEVQKSLDEEEFYSIGFIEGRGTSNEINSYSFTDNNIETGAVYYRLKQLDFDGNYEYSQVIKIEVAITFTEFNLAQNYPNPFNPTTTIKFTVPSVGAYRNTPLQIKVYDVLGNEVATLVNEEKSAGSYEVEFDGSNLSSGIYLYRMRAVDPESSSGQGFVETKKMILLK